MNIIDATRHVPAPSNAFLEPAARALRAGRLVVFPTETVYGLGARADDPDAVRLIFELKRRPFADPLIVHIARHEELHRIVAGVTPLAKRLIRRFWPGPLSVVLPKHRAVPAIVTAGLDTVCVRMPSHPVAWRFLALAGVPVAAPSANLFSRVSPTSLDHVYDDFGDDERIAWAILARPLPYGLESTIVDCTASVPVILRHGAISGAAVARAIGGAVRERTTADPGTSASAPGMLARHYAPVRPTEICTDLGAFLPRRCRRGRLAVVCSATSARRYVHRFPTVRFVVAGDTVHEIGRNLYACLRAAESVADRIVVEAVPARGIGRAIMDRLRRASVPAERGRTP